MTTDNGDRYYTRKEIKRRDTIYLVVGWVVGVVSVGGTVLGHVWGWW